MPSNGELYITESIKKQCERYGVDPIELAQVRSRGTSVNKMSETFSIPRTSLTKMLRDMGLGDIKSQWGKHCDIDPQWLHEEYVVKGRSIYDIADELGVHHNMIWRLNSQYGFNDERKEFKKSQTAVDRLGVDVDWLREEISVKGHNQSEVAKELGAPLSYVREACSELGIRKRRPNNRDEKALRLADEIEASREALESGEMSLTELAKRYGVCRDMARKICTEANIKRARPKKKGFIEQVGHSKQWLEDQLSQGKSAASIAKEVGCSGTSIQRSIKRHDLLNPFSQTLAEKLGITEAWLLDEHIRKGRSCNNIADELGIQNDNIERLCNQWNMQTSLQYVCYVASISEDDLFKMIDDEELSPSEVAKRLDVDLDLVEDVFIHYDRYGEIAKYDFRKWGISDKWIEEERLRKGRSVKELSNELGIPYKIMKKICDNNDLYVKSSPLSEKYGLSDEWFVQKRDEGLSIRQIARELEGVMSRPTIQKIYKEIDQTYKSWVGKETFKENRLSLFEERCEECKRTYEQPEGN